MENIVRDLVISLAIASTIALGGPAVEKINHITEAKSRYDATNMHMDILARDTIFIYRKASSDSKFRNELTTDANTGPYRNFYIPFAFSVCDLPGIDADWLSDFRSQKFAIGVISGIAPSMSKSLNDDICRNFKNNPPSYEQIKSVFAFAPKESISWSIVFVWTFIAILFLLQLEGYRRRLPRQGV